MKGHRRAATLKVWKDRRLGAAGDGVSGPFRRCREDRRHKRVKPDDILREFVRLSNEFGRDPRQVLAGGGNSSAKAGDGTMWVKASGKSMAEMGPADALRMDLAKVLATLDDPELAGGGEETEVRLADRLMEARISPPEAAMRPSVETILHALMPQRYVMHTHPEAANAITCAKGGRKAFERLDFGPGALAAWLDFADPGLPLARAIRGLLEESDERCGRTPDIIFMANHGVIVASDDPGEVRRLARAVERRVESAMRGRLPARPFGPPACRPPEQTGTLDTIPYIASLIRRQFARPRPVVMAMESHDMV
ncbi:MAG: class II aldolase/adducin family protein, partial [Planctomycetota bacterium]|nr:class II aldolase/adducin family protein [Planctomycetota bacterium]